MSDISTIFMQILLLFSVIALGYIAAKCHVLNADSNRHLSNLVICITNPCSILYAVLHGKNTLTNQEVLLLTAIAVGAYGLLILLAHFVPRLLHVTGSDAGVYRFMFVFSNVGFFGFPVVKAVFGSGAVFYAAIFNLVFQFLAYTYGVKQISSRPEDARLRLKTFCKPILIASLLAYVFYLTKFKAPSFVVRVLGFVDQVTSPVCMIVIGCALAAVPVRRVFTNWRLYPILAVKQIAIPLLCYWALAPFVENQLILGITVIMMSMPIAAMTSLFCSKYNNNQELAASGVFMSTLFAIAAIPLMMWLLF